VKLALWNIPHTEKRLSIYLPVGFGLLCWIWWKLCTPLPGYCVALLALAAVIMTVRADKFSIAERGLWVVVGAALVFGEMQILLKDRENFDRQASQDRADQLDRFNRTASGLEQTLTRVDQTLQAADQTLDQTQPRAVVRMTGIKLKDGPQNLEANKKYIFDSSFENDGTAEAVWFRPSVRIYIGKPDDRQDQERLVTAFHNDLAAHANEAFDHVAVVPGQPVWRSDPYTVNEDQLKDLNAGQTLYFLARVDYRDRTGIWRMEVCQHYQRDTNSLSENAMHLCLVQTPFRLRIDRAVQQLDHIQRKTAKSNDTQSGLNH
jgi:hypothetical protein